MVRPGEAERVLAEAAARLRETNRLIALAEAAAPLGHWRYDVATRSFDCSPGVNRIAGLPRATTIDPARLLAQVHLADWRPVLRAFARARRTGGPVMCCARLIGEGRSVRLAVAADRRFMPAVGYSAS